MTNNDSRPRPVKKGTPMLLSIFRFLRGWRRYNVSLRQLSKLDDRQLALFLASERSNHISGKLIHLNDDWKRLEHGNMHPAAYTLRRVQKV
jgi:hypothetical protein